VGSPRIPTVCGGNLTISDNDAGGVAGARQGRDSVDALQRGGEDIADAVAGQDRGAAEGGFYFPAHSSTTVLRNGLQFMPEITEFIGLPRSSAISKADRTIAGSDLLWVCTCLIMLSPSIMGILISVIINRTLHHK